MFFSDIATKGNNNVIATNGNMHCSKVLTETMPRDYVGALLKSFSKLRINTDCVDEITRLNYTRKAGLWGKLVSILSLVKLVILRSYSLWLVCSRVPPPNISLLIPCFSPEIIVDYRFSRRDRRP